MSQADKDRLMETYEELVESISKCEEELRRIIERRDSLVSLHYEVFQDLKELTEDG